MASSDVENSHVLDVIVSADFLESIVYPPYKVAPGGEAIFRWQKDGLRIRVVDGANVLMVEQWIPKDEFVMYNTDFPDEVEDDTLLFGSNCVKINRLLKSTQDEDNVRFLLRDLHGKMEISFSDVEYDLAGITVDSIREPDRPELDNRNKVRVHNGVFRKAQNVVGMVESSIQFKVGEGVFQISGEGDSDSANIELDVTESEGNQARDEVYFYSDESKTTAVFADDYIELIARILPDSFVTAEFEDDYPLQISAEREGGRIETLITLAPRVDPNEN